MDFGAYFQYIVCFCVTELVSLCMLEFMAGLLPTTDTLAIINCSRCQNVSTMFLVMSFHWLS